MTGVATLATVDAAMGLYSLFDLIGAREAAVRAPEAPGGEVQTPSRILVVEDDFFAGAQYEDALTEAGYQVMDIVPTADEAIEALIDHRPELVVMDIRLAGSRDGVDAAIEIFKRFGVRSIFVSAYSDPATRARAEAARPFAWLAKPVSQQKLVASVEAALKALDDGSDVTSAGG